MEFRQLGRSGLKVPLLSFGTATFGVDDPFFKHWGETTVGRAKRLVAICLAHGVNMFDSSDIYSSGVAEEMLGVAIKDKRDQVFISTKATFRTGQHPNDIGASRYHLIKACEASLKRLSTDYIDVYQMHGFDALTPVDETLRALDDLISSGKVRYIGCSNFSGWHLMKSLSVSEQYGFNRYITYQGYYCLIGREYEWELMPLALDQQVGLLAWGPLGYGRLTGKIRRGQPLPEVSRLHKTAYMGPPVNDEFVFDVVDVLDQIAKETGKTIPQIAINWLLQRPTVSSVILGARNEEQLMDNLGALGWQLSVEHMKQLDQISSLPRIYPYWHQGFFEELIPSPV